jgi:hypothetical protein
VDYLEIKDKTINELRIYQKEEKDKVNKILKRINNYND